MLKSQNYSSLENQFLLAMPQLSSYFEDSVTYLWKHTAEAVGMIINKPLQYTETDIFGELEIKCREQKSVIQRQVLSGSPC